MKKTMYLHRSLLRTVFLLFFSVMYAEASYGEENYLSEATVTSKQSLNMRSGPGKQYSVKNQLQPKDIVYVTDSSAVADGWVKIKTSQGDEGYVSSSFLAEKEPVIEEKKERSLKEEFFENGPIAVVWEAITRTGKVITEPFYEFLVKQPVWLVLLIFLFIFALEGYLIYLLKKKYNTGKKMSPLIAYLVVFATMVPTFSSITCIDNNDTNDDLWNMLIVVMMTLGTGCLMLHAAWRIQYNGMGNGDWIEDKDINYRIGSLLANFLWLMVLIPILLAWIIFCREADIRVSESFGNFILTALAIFALKCVLCAIVLPFVVTAFLHIANMSVINLINIFILIGFFSAEINIFVGGYSFLMLVIGLITDLVLIIYVFIFFNEHRCGKCHTFYREPMERIDMGMIIEEREHWEKIPDSVINKRNKDAEVEGAKKLLRTTSVYNRWLYCYDCEVCYNSWNVYDEKMLSEESQELGRKWKEVTYR